MTLLLVFAAIALFLSAVGIYGVLAHSVTQRTKEIGIRLALGAAPSRVLTQTLWQGGRLVALGLVAGVIGAVWMGRLASSLLDRRHAHQSRRLRARPRALVDRRDGRVRHSLAARDQDQRRDGPAARVGDHGTVPERYAHAPDVHRASPVELPGCPNDNSDARLCEARESEGER